MNKDGWKTFSVKEAELAINKIKEIAKGAYVSRTYEERPSPNVNTINLEIRIKVDNNDKSP